ncbi:MAG: type II toxin-antitoxin system HipA family toxin YjjJ [Verrucomicrobiae bacterium]|nr:type II toxin-antitoxin system HipA family toxin YjjJ [Verrucomicrobiae bacterium]
MARPPQITRQSLEPLLLQRGPVSATELADTLAVNRSSIVRALDAVFGPELATLGATRSTRYALRREVFMAGNQWPIYAIDETGRPRHWATVEAFHDRRWRVAWRSESGAPEWAARFSDSMGFWDGFPFFLDDIRPQGFLGRAIARTLSRLLPVPEDPREWSDDHVLLYLQSASEDLPGNLVVGEACLRRVLDPDHRHRTRTELRESDRENRYPILADEAMNVDVGSSAGGEQPKFLATLLSDEHKEDASTPREVIVKFSPPRDQTAGARWADLLACEWIAHEVLAEQGLAREGARLLDAGNRRFLEVPRFDRTPEGGRHGTVSLAALHPEADSYGIARAWERSSFTLKENGLIDTVTRQTIQQLHAFADLIGNTDRHGGNLSFWLTPDLPFGLAPVYDMLPMHWAPGRQGEVVENRSFHPSRPLPGDAEIAWETVHPWAVDYWGRVAASPEVSDAFRAIASESGTTIQRLAKAGW